MPNQPRADNPARTVRIDDSLWIAVKARAKAEGATVSAVIRRALEHYINRGKP